jgi:hypothetical protein
MSFLTISPLKNYEFAIGTLSILTGLIFGILPIVSSYRPVACAAPWDFTIFLLWAIAFGLMKAVFYKDYNSLEWQSFRYGSDSDVLSHIAGHWIAMRQNLWANLGDMVMFLFSFAMGAGVLWVERRRRVQGKESLL